MKEFVEYIVKELVDNTLEVSVTETHNSKKVAYHVRVDEGELGKVIGRNGQNVKAIQTLLYAIAARRGFKATLEIVNE